MNKDKSKRKPKDQGVKAGPPCTCDRVYDTGHSTECPRSDFARGVVD